MKVGDHDPFQAAPAQVAVVRHVWGDGEIVPFRTMKVSPKRAKNRATSRPIWHYAALRGTTWHKSWPRGNLGASIKDAGGRAFMISQVQDPANVALLLAHFHASWDQLSLCTHCRRGGCEFRELWSMRNAIGERGSGVSYVSIVS